MDNVSSFECLKFDSKSEVLAKDDGVKNLFSPAMIPLNCDTPIIGSKPEESRHEESEDEESEDEESEDEESKNEEIGSKTEESESEDEEDEEITKEKLRSFIGECKYCLHVGEHISQLCPYKYDTPKNATLGEGCMVVCSICCCLLRDSCCADCDPSIECKVPKDCPICGKQGEFTGLLRAQNARRNISLLLLLATLILVFFRPTLVH